MPRETSAALFEAIHGEPTYQAVDVGDFRFHLLDGQLGPTWDASDPECDRELGSYGREQLGWLAASLDVGRPSFVLTHYMKLVTKRGEDPDGPFADLTEVLRVHPPELTFVGHTHRWIDVRGDPDWPHIVLGATRYDIDNFWVLELTDATAEEPASWRILDEEKARWFTTCADTWSYVGTPSPVPDAPEEGDCAVGR